MTSTSTPDITEAPASPAPEVKSTTDSVPSVASSEDDAATTNTGSVSAEEPPLPGEAPPASNGDDDGWDFAVDPTTNKWYFFNRFTGAWQWDNPRVPAASGHETQVLSAAPEHDQPVAAGLSSPRTGTGAAGSYNPAIHGDYDPNADYAKTAETVEDETTAVTTRPEEHVAYMATATFNRFTGRYQGPGQTADNYSDENKANRQQRAYYDVEQAANSHDGRSLRAERASQKVSKKQLQQYKKKAKEKKDKKRLAWLRD